MGIVSISNRVSNLSIPYSYHRVQASINYGYRYIFPTNSEVVSMHNGRRRRPLTVTPPPQM